MNAPAGGSPEWTELLVGVARIEGKLDVVTRGHDDHESRLRAIERRTWLAMGAAGLGGGGVGAFVLRLIGG